MEDGYIDSIEGDKRHDFGYAKLVKPAGSTARWLDLEAHDTYGKVVVHTAGYPADHNADWMYTTTCTLDDRDAKSNVAEHTCDETNGDSGGPTFTWTPGQRARLVGMMSGGTCGDEHPAYEPDGYNCFNFFQKLTTRRFNNVSAHRSCSHVHARSRGCHYNANASRSMHIARPRQWHDRVITTCVHSVHTCR